MVSSIISANDVRRVTSSTSARLGIVAPANLDVADAIMHKAAQLAEDGFPVTIACASRWSAARLARLARETGLSDRIRVAFIMDIALETLANPCVQDAVKRTDRVLDRNEMDVLVEDVKVTGIAHKRLKEMLDFFFRSISDCSAEQEGWLVTREEATAFAVLEENLEARRACLPCEPAAKAYQGMRAAGIVPEPQIFVVDDFGSLSASAQRLIEYMSGGNIIAFGNDEFRLAADEPHPAPEGMRSFLDDARTQVIELRSTDASRNQAVTLPTPLMEFDYVADLVASLLRRGRTPEEVAIAVPNVTWGKYIAKALSSKEISASLDVPAGKVKGDPRDPKSCSEIKLNAFAKLLRNADDFTAFRTFVGVGDWLLRSDGFLELLAYAREHGLEAREAIRIMCEPEHLKNVTISFKKLVNPIREYDELRTVWETGTITQICEAMKRHGMPLGSRAALLGTDEKSPRIEAFVASFDEGADGSRGDCVSIAPYERIRNHCCKTLVIAGMVDGFMPKRDAVDDSFAIDHRTRAMKRDGRTLASIEAVASENVFYSNFDHDAIENTAALHMVTTRIYHKDGRRMARVSPSSLLA